MAGVRVKFLEDFLSRRGPKEKVIALTAAALLFLFADFTFLARPMFRTLMEAAPKLSSLGKELERLKADDKDKDAIRLRWQESKKRLAEEEARFVSAGEVSALLESLSQQAFDSGIKITSLRPLEVSQSSLSRPRYQPLSVQMNALAGTHEFGSFLAGLETAGIFFKVTDLKITENPADERRHLVELKMEIYKRQ